MHTSGTVHTNRVKRGLIALALAASVLFAMGAFGADRAIGEEIFLTSSRIDLQQFEIETLTNEYESAKAQAEEASADANAAQARVNETQALVDKKQDRADTALHNLYVLEDNKYTLIDNILCAETIDDLIKYSEYVERISRVTTSDLNEYKDLLAQLQQERDAFEASRQEASEQEEAAYAALLSLQNQRAAKQRAAMATDGADWYMSKEEFIEEWAPRIDAYFAGTPMADTGAYFAAASWYYCIDPRWSAAISCIESSKGAYCIRPHNAWGWGAADSDPYNLASEWGSWEEAIFAHAKGLAHGYGYTVTEAGAEAYCPLNAEEWYSKVVSEMASI